MTKIDRLYSAVEVSKILGISRSTLRQMTEDGDIQAVQIGQRRKYSQDHIQSYLEDKEVNNR